MPSFYDDFLSQKYKGDHPFCAPTFGVKEGRGLSLVGLSRGGGANFFILFLFHAKNQKGTPSCVPTFGTLERVPMKLEK